MSRARWSALGMVLLGAAAEAQPMPGEGPWGRLSEATRLAYGAALAERFATCHAAEGHRLDAHDRAVVSEVTSGMGVAVLRGLDDVACGPEEGSQRACVAALGALSCAELSRRLSDAGVDDEDEAPAAWAEGYARGLASRIGRCYAVERGDDLLTVPDSEALSALRREVARGLGQRAARGGCVVDENAIPACGSSLRGMSCEALAARVDGPLSQLEVGLTEACGQMLRCPTEAEAGR